MDVFSLKKNVNGNIYKMILSGIARRICMELVLQFYPILPAWAMQCPSFAMHVEYYTKECA